ncbi:MAG: cysteine hydrolase [Deltaproteobacteria bacterium]|nr:cysteine hydrolase [Deltaproteobacteria bacterium]
MMEKSAVLVVDMLKGFFKPNPLLPTRTNEITQNNRRVVQEARKIGIPVVFVNDNFQPSEIPIDRHFKLFGVHAVAGTEDAEILPELEFDSGKDFVVGKKLYDGFFNTRLDSILRELGVKLCVFTGTWTNACVQHTVMGAWCRGYDVILLEDCSSSFNEIDHNYAIEYMKKFYGAKIMKADEWIKMVRESL